MIGEVFCFSFAHFRPQLRILTLFPRTSRPSRAHSPHSRVFHVHLAHCILIPAHTKNPAPAGPHPTSSRDATSINQLHSFQLTQRFSTFHPLHRRLLCKRLRTFSLCIRRPLGESRILLLFLPYTNHHRSA